MYRTLPSWKRATQKQKDRAVEAFKNEKVKPIRCECCRCWNCGCLETVAWSYHKKDMTGANPTMGMDYMNYCVKCGCVKINGKGEMFGDHHYKKCPSAPDKFSLLPEVWGINI